MDKTPPLDNKRSAGSLSEFGEEWEIALRDENSRYIGHPSLETKRQNDFLEWIKAQQILEIIEPEHISKVRVLEYGCGSAGISLFLASLGYHSHICDLSLEALRVARRNQQLHYPEVDFHSRVNANVLKLPYAEESFEIVMSYGLLEHFEIEVLNVLLDESVRILKPGGLFIADIIPGPERFSVRTLGILANYLGSAGHKILTGRWSQLKGLHQNYFEHYFETSFDDRTWAELLKEHGLVDVQVQVCRPFPPLALSGVWETRYTELMNKMIDFHERFDKTNNWLTRRWGWMYLASARKPELIFSN